MQFEEDIQMKSGFENKGKGKIESNYHNSFDSKLYNIDRYW